MNHLSTFLIFGLISAAFSLVSCDKAKDAVDTTADVAKNGIDAADKAGESITEGAGNLKDAAADKAA
ncbi:MAG: hypothetical protein GWQ05_14665, partial [Verrucomicrobiaceae bacterium]|nr:hypothetical protein [Verrucomicrobiaceae bacterium]